MAHKRMEWALETDKGMVDAVPYKGSLLKYCACPGRQLVCPLQLSRPVYVLNVSWVAPVQRPK